MEPLAREHHAGLHQLLVELSHLGEEPSRRGERPPRSPCWLDQHHESHRHVSFWSGFEQGRRSRPASMPSINTSNGRAAKSTNLTQFFGGLSGNSFGLRLAARRRRPVISARFSCITRSKLTLPPGLPNGRTPSPSESGASWIGRSLTSPASRHCLAMLAQTRPRSYRRRFRAACQRRPRVLFGRKATRGSVAASRSRWEDEDWSNPGPSVDALPTAVTNRRQVAPDPAGEEERQHSGLPRR